MSVDLFRSIGLADALLESLGKNVKLSAKLEEVIAGAGVASTGCDSTKGNLLYHVATKMKDTLGKHRAFLGKHIAAGHLQMNVQVCALAPCAPVLLAAFGCCLVH